MTTQKQINAKFGIAAQYQALRDSTPHGAARDRLSTLVHLYMREAGELYQKLVSK